MGSGSGAASSTEHGDTRGKDVVAPACVRENGEGGRVCGRRVRS